MDHLNAELTAKKRRLAKLDEHLKSSPRTYHINGSPSVTSISGIPEHPEDAKLVINQHKAPEVVHLDRAQPAPVQTKKKFHWLGGSNLGSSSSASNMKPIISGPSAPVKLPNPTPEKPAPHMPVSGSRPDIGQPFGGKRIGSKAELTWREHTFQASRVSGLAKCDLCGDKMWGRTEMRCTGPYYVDDNVSGLILQKLVRHTTIQNATVMYKDLAPVCPRQLLPICFPACSAEPF